MQCLQRSLAAVGHSAVPVLISGESGTGKEILARVIHQRWSQAGQRPFVKVSCPAIPETLLESELFGYERGAFTGASAPKPGRVELAHRGTLFLDEIGEMDLGIQAKLLHFLQDGRFCRIGGQEDRQVEVRVICATNRDLQTEIAAGRFRHDLFYRINVVHIQVPALRDRPEDIPLLANYLLECYSHTFGTAAKPLRAPLLEIMQRHSWPGNIRQLENAIKRYVVFGDEEAIASELISSTRRDPFNPVVPRDGKISLKAVTREATKELERRIIFRVLNAHNWNRKKAAKAMSISYRALLYKLEENRTSFEHPTIEHIAEPEPVA
jgi:two-component system response regulator AtoC